MPGRVEGKVAVVTGGASGIGEGMVRLLLAEGASVVIADLQAEPGAALVAELGERTRFVRTDVTVEADVAAAVELAVSAFGALDVMCNNAGVVGVIGPIATTDAAAWDTTIAILLSGVMYGMKHAARVMSPRRSGSIISTSSIAGVIGGLGPHCYTAAKHAVIGLTKSVAAELAADGVRVNAIAPGNVVTPLTADVISGDHTDIAGATEHIARSNPLKVGGLPIDIAQAALYLASEESRYMSGQTLVVDGGQTTNGGSSRFHRSAPALVRHAGRRDDLT